MSDVPWPDNCIQRGFVEGAKYYQFISTGFTSFRSEVDEYEKKAIEKYGEPSDTEELLSKATSFLIWSLEEDSGFDITIEKRNREKNLWAVVRTSFVWSKQEKRFVYEPSPSNRDDGFLEHTRFEFQEALDIAQKIAALYEKARQGKIV